MEVEIVPRSRASRAQRRLATVLGLDWTARSMNFFHAAMASRVLRVFVLLHTLCTRPHAQAVPRTLHSSRKRGPR